MVLNTKFDKDQLVWFIHENKIHKGTIHSLAVSLYNSGFQNEIYCITYGSSTISKTVDKLFSSKDELIQSIE